MRAGLIGFRAGSNNPCHHHSLSRRTQRGDQTYLAILYPEWPIRSLPPSGGRTPAHNRDNRRNVDPFRGHPPQPCASRSPQVRVISVPRASQLGIHRHRRRRSNARARRTASIWWRSPPNAVPPVCRILDFGKYVYEEQKKHLAREIRREQDQGDRVHRRASRTTISRPSSATPRNSSTTATR